jgi:hypothetical protein
VVVEAVVAHEARQMIGMSSAEIKVCTDAKIRSNRWADGALGMGLMEA